MEKPIEDILKKYIADFKTKQSEVIVPSSIPIVWFGDIYAYFKSQIKIVTIALNPSKNEFPETYNSTAKPRFIDKSLIADRLYTSLNEYFKFNPYKIWFSHFESCLNKLGASFGGIMSSGIQYNNTALSIDYFSSIATDPTFSRLSESSKKEIDQRVLFFDLLKFLNPDIAIMSTAKEYFRTVFDTSNKIYEAKGKTEIYRVGNSFAIWGRNIKGTPCVFDKDILTEWVETMQHNPKEGVFWAMSLDKDKIESGKFYLICDFCGQESHSNVWKKQQQTHPELLGFDYEFFPRGRVWKNKNNSQKAYTVFIPRILNCNIVLTMINKHFCLNGDYLVALED